MNNTKLGVGQLLEGGLWLLWEAKGRAIGWAAGFTLLQLFFLASDRQDIAWVADLTISAVAPWWVWLLVNMIGQSALMVLATASLMPDAELRRVESTSVPRLFGLATLVHLLSSIAIGVGLILLLVPGLYLAARWYLLLPLIVSRRAKPGDAFSESWDALDGNVGAIIGAILVMFIPLALLAGIELSASGTGALPGVLGLVIDALLTGASSVFGIGISIFAFRELFHSGDEYRTVFD